MLSEGPGKTVKNIVAFNDRYAPQVRKKEAIDVEALEGARVVAERCVPKGDSPAEFN